MTICINAFCFFVAFFFSRFGFCCVHKWMMAVDLVLQSEGSITFYLNVFKLQSLYIHKITTKWKFHTWRPELIWAGSVRVPRRVGIIQEVSDPQHARQRLHSGFRALTALPHCVPLSICSRRGLFSEVVLSRAQQMSSFTLDEERARHGSMMLEGAEAGWKCCTVNLQVLKVNAFMSLLEPRALRCQTPVGASSVTMLKFEVSFTNTARHLHAGLGVFTEDNPAANVRQIFNCQCFHASVWSPFEKRFRSLKCGFHIFKMKQV